MPRFNLRMSRVRPVRRYVGETGEVYSTLNFDTGEALVSKREARRIIDELQRIFPEASGKERIEQAEQRSNDGWSSSFVEWPGR